jgi:hypothetical protein
MIPYMFATIRHTFELMKMSWHVLQKDRELVFFPIMSAVTMLITVGTFALVANATGTMGRYNDMSNEVPGATMNAGDVTMGISIFFLTTFIGIFFNAALISAALERLRGGDPNISSGLSHAVRHLPAIIGWAIVAATVGLLLQLLRNMAKDNFLGQIAVSMVGGVWAYLTFFVIPVLVAEELGPIAAFKRSKEMFSRTWGNQFAASFGFGLVYMLAVLAALIPSALLFFIHPFLGIAGGAFFFAIALGGVAAMEGIFKAALYQYAAGETATEFDQTVLSSAYRAL